jgi:polyphosphate kinase
VVHDEFVDRELSQLHFNRRVLALAQDEGLPLLEPLRYLCIVGNNMDEFFEVRVAELFTTLRDPNTGANQRFADTARYRQICDSAHALVAQQYETYNESIVPALEKFGVRLLHHYNRTPEQQAWVTDYFEKNVRPLITPIALDPAHPFPQVSNKSLNFIIELSGHNVFGQTSNIAILKAPRVVPRVIELPRALCNGYRGFVLLSSMIRSNMEVFFAPRQIVSYSQFRVTRDSELWIDLHDPSNLRQALRGKLTTRSFGRAVRLEVSHGCPEHLQQLLSKQFELAPTDVYAVDGPVNIVRLDALVGLINDPKQRFPAFKPSESFVSNSDSDVFARLREGDLLLHHPFESFDPVLDFVSASASDKEVMSIKMTIYRTGSESALMESLVSAAQRGKEVTVVLELKARFDEETNINWAERLEKVGAQVVYGVVGLKTHAKMALVHRREGTKLRAYAHFGTGNYNPNTARSYTDFGLMTANPTMCREASLVFNHLTSSTRLPRLEHLWVAPFSLARNVISAIEAEAEISRSGKRGRIVAKMNALVDESIVRALYAASNAGVEIDLIVRGACVLRPGVAGMSENIRVRSVVGRFLEHSRIYCFGNAGQPRIYLSSADWMGRNLFRRVEVAFPVLDERLAYRVVAEGVEPYLRDNTYAWELNAHGDYTRVKSKRKPRAAQKELLALLSE